MTKLVFLYAAVAILALAQTQHKPGEKFKECRNCPEMIVVPAGTFMMGLVYKLTSAAHHQLYLAI